MEFSERKYRSEETWAAVRRGWEQGQTAASLARRYDVGLANLWRRRAAEGWVRRRAPDPVPEPLEGWERYAERKLDEWDFNLTETRQVALKLAEAMAGGPLHEVPLWHLGFVLNWRAEHLNPETAARDRDWARRYGWTQRLWDETTGRLHPLGTLDRVTLEANAAAWREDVGLPEGAAPNHP